jgi:hypothetical protein
MAAKTGTLRVRTGGSEANPIQSRHCLKSGTDYVVLEGELTVEGPKDRHEIATPVSAWPAALECADLSALCAAATRSYSLNFEHLLLDKKAATGRRTPYAFGAQCVLSGSRSTT